MSATEVILKNGVEAIEKAGHSAAGSFALESGGFLIAEAVSILAGLGTVAATDLVIPKSAMKYGAQVLGKAVVEPFLDQIDYVSSKICKLDECKPDADETREQRAERFGKVIIVFGAAYAISMAAKLFTRRAWNEHHNIIEDLPAPISRKEVGTWNWIKHHATFQSVSPKEKMIFAADEGVHYASLYLLNNQAAPLTDAMIRKSTKLIHDTTGLSEEKSHEISTMAWVWDAPNILGAVAGIGAIAGAHFKGWHHPDNWVGKVLQNKPRTDLSHVEKLAKESGTSYSKALS